MEISYDPAKNERNIRERGLSFDRAVDFDFESAVIMTERRKNEDRFVAVGYLDGRLYVLCFLETQTGIRVVSFRKANQREAKRYGKPKTVDE